MPLRGPEPGLVVSYAYLWRHEAAQGLQEGRKDRPCVIVAAVEQNTDGTQRVTVLPITHQDPGRRRQAKALGLDLERSWVMVDEANLFTWPGYDLRKVPGSGDFHYGFLPPNFFNKVMSAGRAWLKRHGLTVTPR